MPVPDEPETAPASVAPTAGASAAVGELDATACEVAVAVAEPLAEPSPPPAAVLCGTAGTEIAAGVVPPEGTAAGTATGGASGAEVGAAPAEGRAGSSEAGST